MLVVINGNQEPILLRQVQTLFGVGTVCGLTDGELLERYVARRGELSELAFTALLERHGRMVLGICHRMLTDPHDVQDAFQATFLVLVRRARSIRNRDSVASWLHGVAFRVACSARSAAVRRRRHERAHAEQAGRFVAELHEENDNLKKVLDEELSRLPERYRAVVVLCDLEELSYEQAARSLGWPMGTVKSRLARGRDKLRTCLLHRGVAPVAGLIGASWIGENACAEVSAELLQTTVQAALRVATHRVGAHLISPSVLSLTEGVISTMLLTKLKLSAGGLLIGASLVSLAVVFASPGLRAVAREPRSIQTNPSALADQELKAKLDESTTLAAKLQKEVQKLRRRQRRFSQA
jgi:polysaccharide export outer membrane protein